MLALVVIAALIGMAALVAGYLDWHDRRQGAERRGSGAVETEAMHSRVDINAVPYEPARRAGQRDWATYRQRDRKRDH